MSLQNITPAERLIGKDRIITIAGLTALTLLSWVWLLTGAGADMNSLSMVTFQFPPPVMDGMTMSWSIGYGMLMLTMWWIMMIAMMVPSAAPMILLYGRVARHAQNKGQIEQGVLPTFVFVLGYLTIWFGFSALATAAQWGLERTGLMHHLLMWSTSTALTALLLLAAGLYQLTPLKRVCLEHCRFPADYLSTHWRHGRSGAFKMGITHGAYCLGCCWLLMALLFAGGVMNLVWIAGLAIVVGIEKIAPWGARFSQSLAMFMIGGGIWLLWRGAA
jgi:predicted metal-binding membrane protein